MFGFSKDSNEANEMNVYFHEDHSSKEVREDTVGRKGMSLFKLRDMDVPIPDFFVISPNVYRDFLFSAFDRKLGKLLEKVKDPDVKELEKMILSTDFDDMVRDDLIKAYSRLSGFSNAWVAVRSSVVYPVDSSVSFSGIFGTELSVRGLDQLFAAIKQVYLSVFKERVVLYSRDKNVDVSSLQMAVVIQRMVQPEVSGIAYTVDPVTGDKGSMSIEAVFGLGDVITEGAITPDRYSLEKKHLDIVEKHISPQEWMRIRRPSDKKVGAGDDFQKIQISRSWSHQQKLEDPHLIDVAKVCLIIEHQEKKAQIIEWCWESGNVWILQSKPISDPASEFATQNVAQKPIETDSVYDIAVDIMKEELSERNAAIQRSEQLQPKSEDETPEEPVAPTTEEIAIQQKQIEKIEKKVQQMDERRQAKKDKAVEKKVKDQQKTRAEMGLPISPPASITQFLLSGIGSSVGIVMGKLSVIDGASKISNDIYTKDDILLIKNFNSSLEPFVMQAGGVIMDEGGLTSDVSILCRELNVPAVVGTGLASTLLRDGDYVKIDGNVGSIYKIVRKEDLEPQKKEVEAKSAPVVNENEKTSDLDLEKVAEDTIKASVTPEVQKDATDRYIPTATKVLLLPGQATLSADHKDLNEYVDGISYIDLEAFMLEAGRHPLAFVAEKKFKEYSKQFELILDEYSDNAEGKEVVVALGSATVGQMRGLTKGSSYEDATLDQDLFGAQRLVRSKELLNKELEMIRRVRNVYKSRNVSVAIHAPSNIQAIKEVKKELTSNGLKRTGTFNVYVIIDSTSEIILIDEIVSAGIDGVIVNTPLIARQLQGLSRFDKNAKYDLGTNSLWNIISELLEKLKDSRIKVSVVTDDNVSLVKNCVRSGVNGIIVSPEYAKRMKQFVADEEAKMILSME